MSEAAAHPDRIPVREGEGGQKLDPETAAFYDAVWASARAGCMRVLRQSGCSETEAEEVFGDAFLEVMRTKDPIGRQFAEAQMVNLLKVVCRRRLIDKRRHRDVIQEVALSAAEGMGDDHYDGPAELALRSQEIEVGREALMSLSRRDRLIFRMRHQMELTPEEIQANLPGLSLRGYRKSNERANARVLAAYERIDRGERCEEMERHLLRRFVSEEATQKEREDVEAHLKHCRSCQRSTMRMRGYLLDIGSTLAGVVGVGATSAAAGWSLQVSELVHGSSDLFVRAVGGLRDRGRDLGHWASGAGPSGSGAQLLGFSGIKVGGACASVAVAATCAAVGVVPGVAPLQLGGDAGDRPVKAALEAPAVRANTEVEPFSSGLSTEALARRARVRTNQIAREEGTKKRARREAVREVSADPAPASAAQVTSEFGAESASAGTPIAAPEPEAVEPPASSGGGGSTSGGSGSGGAPPSPEFGL